VTTASTAGAAAATAATDTGASDTGEAATTVAQNDTSTTAPSGSEAPAATTAPATQPSGDATAPAADSSQTGSTETPAAEPAQDKTQILFPEGSAELPPEATQQLDTIAQKMDENQALRLQLMAYASGTEDTASRARRISLSRALAVRAYLIDKGIRSTRMDVRALGNKVEGDPADRVDIVTLTPGG
jgi:outer membrane protein OmpA-like peptidoglycan-associated protein